MPHAYNSSTWGGARQEDHKFEGILGFRGRFGLKRGWGKGLAIASETQHEWMFLLPYRI